MIPGVAMDPEIRDCNSETHWKKTFSDLDYSLIGYDILFGYPLANGRDPGFRQPIFTANYSKPKQTANCRHVIPQGFTVIPSESCVVSFDSKLIHNKQQMSIHLGVQASVKGLPMKCSLLIAQQNWKQKTKPEKPKKCEKAKIAKFCILRMPELWKLIVCAIRGPYTV